MLITSVTHINKNRNIVFCCGERVALLSDRELFEYGISEPAEEGSFEACEIEDSVAEELSELMYKRALPKAVDLISMSGKSEAEVVRKLYNYGFSEDVIKHVINRLTEKKYINDERLSENFVRYNKDRLSSNELKLKLMQKGVDKEIISNAFRSEEVSKETEREACRKLLEKRLSGKEPSEDQYRKAITYACGKGFEYETVKSILRELAEE